MPEQPMTDECRLKRNWAETRARFHDWWEGRGLLLNLGDFPIAGAPPAPGDPGEAPSAEVKHRDPAWIAARSRALRLGRNYELGDILPVAWGDWGTVPLAAYLGAQVELGMDTIWYHPRPGGLADWGELVFDPEHPWFRTQMEIYRHCVAAADGDFCIGQPGLGSNIEVLAALRGSQALMVDLIEDPGLVRARLEEINLAFFAAFDRVAEVIRLPSGGVCSSYFAIYGPGRTSVVTLDPVAMISPAMFREFVVPPLRVQLAGLDRSLLHVDGTAALRHLDAILALEDLDAVEWTPEPTMPGGGDPRWYPLYRRIKEAGKAVQAILVKPPEVRPLLDAVGPEGMYVTAYCRDAAEAETLLAELAPYRRVPAADRPTRDPVP